MYQIFLTEGWTFEDYNEYEIAGINREETSEFNKRLGCTQVSQANVENLDDLN